MESSSSSSSSEDENYSRGDTLSSLIASLFPSFSVRRVVKLAVFSLVKIEELDQEYLNPSTVNEYQILSVYEGKYVKKDISTDNQFNVRITIRSRSSASGANHKLQYGQSYTDKYFDDELAAIRYYSENVKQLGRRGYYQMKINYEDVEHLVLDQPVSQLDAAIVKLIKHFLNEHMPLGIYDLNEINDARSVLPTLFDPPHAVIKKSNQFYQMIHHAGWSSYDKGNRLPIGTIKIKGSKLEMLAILESVIRALEDGINSSDINALDHFYNAYLQIELTPISDSTEFARRFGLQGCGLPNLFKFEKSVYNDQFQCDIGNVHILFHVTRASHMIGILKEGLLPAPTYVNSMNRWLGDGIYFFGSYKAAREYAERCFCNCILVCRVALGNSVIEPKCSYNNNPTFKYPLSANEHSITQLGKKYRTVFKLENELQAKIAIAHNTQCFEHNPWERFVDFDEFVVQNKNQVKIEYLIII